MNVAPPSKKLNGIALCAGAGGLELGLSLAIPGYHAVCWVERDAYAASALVARMENAALDDAPVWSDLGTFDGKPWRGKVDIITAGYPCQPFSACGLRLGERDPRHLWPHVARILRESEAPFLFCENVEGHISLGFETVRNDLLELGYGVQAGIFSAAEIGAPHQRKRLFFLAYSGDAKLGDLAGHILAGRENHLRQGGLSIFSAAGGNSLDDIVDHGDRPSPRLFPPGPSDLAAWKKYLSVRPGCQPAIFRGSDGLAHRVDRLRLAGNGVCPLAAAHAFATLALDACRRQ